MTDEKKPKNYPIIIEKWVRTFMKTMDKGDLEAGDDSGNAPFGVKIIFDGYGIFFNIICKHTIIK